MAVTECVRCATIEIVLPLGEGVVGPTLVDSREHRFQLGVVGALVLLLTSFRQPKVILGLAAVTAFPMLPVLFRRWIAPRLGPAAAVEDSRLPAFARMAGGAGLAIAAGLAVSRRSRVAYPLLSVAGCICIYGAATGYCVPCNALMTLERLKVISLDPPLVCAVRH